MRISDWSSDVCSSDLALAIGARHILARSGLRELPAGLGRKLVAQRFHLALAQRVDQPGREADAARLPLGEALANEMFGPPVPQFGRAPFRVRVWPYV